MVTNPNQGQLGGPLPGSRARDRYGMRTLNHITKQPKPEMRHNLVGFGIAIGSALGLLFGLLFGNLILGVAWGAALGLVVSSMAQFR
jgi:hypothetical protein